MIWNETIDNVISLHQKAYKLLLWVQGAMDSGWISPGSAHKNMSAADVTKDWLLKHYSNIPKGARPSKDNQDAIDAFCNLFSTFLVTSFDINEQPGKRLYSEAAHCFCPMCSYMIQVSYLKPKKLTKKDKARAKKLKLNALRQLCLDVDLEWQEEFIENLSENKDTFEETAIIAYSYELVRRAKGVVEGPAVLVLWRDFAWNKSGGPKKNFKFGIEIVTKAKDEIVKRLRDNLGLQATRFPRA